MRSFRFNEIGPMIALYFRSVVTRRKTRLRVDTAQERYRISPFSKHTQLIWFARNVRASNVFCPQCFNCP